MDDVFNPNDGWERSDQRKAFVILLMTIFLVSQMTSHTYASWSIEGDVVNLSGEPLENAKVTIIQDEFIIKRGVTDAEGRFELEVEDEGSYSIYVFTDEEATPGLDYLPSKVDISPASLEEITFTLVPAASFRVVGSMQFVESEELPYSIIYAVVDPETKEVIMNDGIPLMFGSGSEVQNRILDIDDALIIVPARSSFIVVVNSSILVGSSFITRSFEIENLEPLGRGEEAVLDPRVYSVAYNLELVSSLKEQVGEKLDEMGAIGFYLVRERKEVMSALNHLTEGYGLYDQELLVESFTACRKSFIQLMTTNGRLEAVVKDASISVYIILTFLAFTATTIAFLFSDKTVTKLALSVIVYAISMGVIYVIYPGIVLVPVAKYLLSGLFSIMASILVALVFPRFMKGAGGNGHVPMRNIVVPIFSMAKRTILRRRLRFILTLTSIFMLVMSFIVLTSFSEGYGLISQSINVGPVRSGTILIRSHSYKDDEPVYISWSDSQADWLRDQYPGVVISPKRESFPLGRSVATLNGVPLRGIIGVDPSSELRFLDDRPELSSLGHLTNTGLILSTGLQKRMGLSVGDTVSLSDIPLTLEAVIEDNVLRSLREIDGSSYLPIKLVNINPPGETPMYVTEPSDPTEVVIVHLSTSARIPFVGLAGIQLGFEEEFDVTGVAERLALERGYLVWSSSKDGVLRFRLGVYQEGKGLPLLVPWAIVVLNVVVTMLNSLYERRKEIYILSSTGLNPTQISSIFIAEALILGLTAGGLGYLAGLGFYKVLVILGFSLEVQQKVSAFWSLASIGISMTAVLIGAYAAIRSSLVITPSLNIRWRITDERADCFQPFEMDIPLRLSEDDIRPFLKFVLEALNRLKYDALKITSNIKMMREWDGEEAEVKFIYKIPSSVAGNLYTRNILIIKMDDSGEVKVRLISHGEESWAHDVGTMVRMIIMRWSTSDDRSNTVSNSQA